MYPLDYLTKDRLFSQSRFLEDSINILKDELRKLLDRVDELEKRIEELEIK